MIPLFSTRQIREVDEFAIKHLTIPGIVLMENAALKIFNTILERIVHPEKYKKIGIICGKGNNGGDGFSVAKHFANNGFSVTVIHLGSEGELSNEAEINFRILKNISAVGNNLKLIKFSSKNELKKLKDSDILIDAILGSGLSGDLREPYKEIVTYLNENINAFKVAVDIPTGLNSDTGYSALCFKADLTVSLGELKKGLFFGHGYANSGEVVRGNIGINYSYFDKYKAEDYLIEPEDAYNALPVKGKSIHKYSAGKVFTIAGSGELPGAAAMTAKAALKAGAGASILAFPHSVRKLIYKNLSEVIIKTYDDKNREHLSSQNIKELIERMKWADVIAIGPGLGRSGETQEAVLQIIKKRKSKKIIIDADAIYALKDGRYKNYDLKNSVFTPHHGEFSTLLGIDSKDLKKNILKFGKDFVTETSAYLVLKGAPTIIFTPEGEALINTTGNPGMAKFGTGDVLTGVLAGLAAQSDDLEQALIAGVYIHSLSADLLAEKKSELTYTAEDIINNLSSSIKFLRKSVA